MCLLLLLMLCVFYGKVDIVISCNEMNKVLSIMYLLPMTLFCAPGAFWPYLLEFLKQVKGTRSTEKEKKN